MFAAHTKDVPPDAANQAIEIDARVVFDAILSDVLSLLEVTE